MDEGEYTVRVVIACEESATVGYEFFKRGHEVITCDLQPTRSTRVAHYQGDIFQLLNMFPDDYFDLMIGHPECKYMTLAGARWFYDPGDKSKPHPDYPDRWQQRDDAIDFFLKLMNTKKAKKICLENSQPLGYVMDRIGRYDQKVQPWMFGSPYTKGACLWLKGLPGLMPTHDKPDVVTAKCHNESPGPDRSKRRSETNIEIARAMAEQWG